MACGARARRGTQGGGLCGTCEDLPAPHAQLAKCKMAGVRMPKCLKHMKTVSADFAIWAWEAGWILQPRKGTNSRFAWLAADANISVITLIAHERRRLNSPRHRDTVLQRLT